MRKDCRVSATQRPMLVVSAPAPRDAAEIITREQSPADPRDTPTRGTRDKGCFPLRYCLQGSLPMNLTQSSAWGESLEVSGKPGMPSHCGRNLKCEGDAGESACAQPPSGPASRVLCRLLMLEDSFQGEERLSRKRWGFF